MWKRLLMTTYDLTLLNNSHLADKYSRKNMDNKLEIYFVFSIRHCYQLIQ